MTNIDSIYSLDVIVIGSMILVLFMQLLPSWIAVYVWTFISTLIFIYFRSTTLRFIGIDDSGKQLYDHMETDEKIFEALVASVRNNFFDYSLIGKPILDHISKENYSDSLFLHPPLFVYSSLFLSYYVPLPLVPIIFQAITLLEIVAMAALLSPKENMLHAIVWATVIFSTCPVAWFCSQKFWIDNALVASVSSAALVHIVLTSSAKTSKTSRYNFLSGLFFGMIAMNTKISALALFPFMMCWSFHQSYDRSEPLFLLCKKLASILLALVLGLIFGASPWMIIYYVSFV